jgi:hypothetical protein
VLDFVNVVAKPAALIEVAQHGMRQEIHRVHLIGAHELLLTQMQVFQRRAQLMQIRLPLTHGWPSFPSE